MSDDDKLSLRPASAKEIQESLSFALRYAERKRVHHAALSGYVLMKRPERAAPSTSGHGHPNAAD